MRIFIAFLLVKSIVTSDENSFSPFFVGENEISAWNQTVYHDAKSDVSSQRIFQGSPAGQPYPFMVALVVLLQTPLAVCGASLIDNQRIITAAHCINTIRELMTQNRRVEAWVGAQDLDSFTGQRIQLTSFMRHPLYSAQIFNWNDVGIITLATNVRFNSQASPICIQTRCPNNDPVKTIGFGISDCRQPSRKLLVGNGRAFGSAQCRRLGYPSLALRGQLCIQNSEGAGSADRGDSGGPLFTQSGTQYSLVGLVSHGLINETTLCPQIRVPTVYTQVAAYRLFIRLYAPGATFC